MSYRKCIECGEHLAICIPCRIEEAKQRNQELAAQLRDAFAWLKECHPLRFAFLDTAEMVHAYLEEIQ